ncbi:MAG: hypothetical protein JW768_03800 [Chitinispirillaceae bacterium]|nr:hypothetical protein [Chitinispirillaceae bacterium]
MRSIITMPVKIILGIAGTVIKIVTLLVSFLLKTARFAGGRLFTVIVGGVVGFFLGKKYFAKKNEEEKQE